MLSENFNHVYMLRDELHSMIAYVHIMLLMYFSDICKLSCLFMEKICFIKDNI